MDAITAQRHALHAISTGVNAITAKGHVELAINSAKHGAVDRSVLEDLEAAKAALERAVKGAERCRKRAERAATAAGKGAP